MNIHFLFIVTKNGVSCIHFLFVNIHVQFALSECEPIQFPSVLHQNIPLNVLKIFQSSLCHRHPSYIEML